MSRTRETLKINNLRNLYYVFLCTVHNAVKFHFWRLRLVYIHSVIQLACLNTMPLCASVTMPESISYSATLSSPWRVLVHAIDS